MGETNYWLTVANGLEVARTVGMLTVCTCGRPEWPDGVCGHCRLEAAHEALWKLRTHSLAREKTLELLQNRGKRRVVFHRRLAQSLARVADHAPHLRREMVEPTPLRCGKRRRTEQRSGTAASGPACLHACMSLRSEVLEEVTDALSGGAEWERSAPLAYLGFLWKEMLEEATAEMAEEMDLGGRGRRIWGAARWRRRR